MNYDWNFGRLVPYAEAFLQGTVTTLTLTAFVVVLGTVVGVLLGLLLRFRRVSLLLYPIIDIVRAIPPLVLLLFTYYSLTVDVIGFAVSGYWVYVIAMSTNLASFTADLVRSAVEGLPTTVLETGKALGMNDRQILRHLYVPHLVRSLLPAMTAIYIGMLKMSSLASIINVADVVYAAQTVTAEISRSLEAWTVVAAIYVVIVVPLTYVLRSFEGLSRRGTRTIGVT